MGDIASQSAIMSVTDMPVLNYDVIYDMCEPQVKSCEVSYQSGGGKLIYARGQLRSLMTLYDQRCERITRPGGGLIHA